MMTEITQSTCWARVGARLRKQARYMTSLALVAVPAGTVAVGTAIPEAICQSSTSSGFSGLVFATGSSTGKKFQVEQKGPTDVYQGTWIWQPGGDSGWHTHPGQVIFVIQSGELTEHQSNGCTRILRAGTVIVEPAGVLHDVVNDRSEQIVEAWITLLTPAGVPFFTPAPPPAPQACTAQNG